MKIYVLLFLAVVVYKEISCSYIKSSKYSTSSSPIHSDDFGRLWKTRTEWKSHWVKEWHIKKIYVPIWKKVWTPVEIKEWLPLPSISHK
ncbi:uncharacterized protein LOC115885761 [Sitophilus oryzae]|uniref:Uncharacterized protein LOC115885761 n=1 Tax=Sitophilus oryzae TaxID=7048 RepID=A0A6J2YBJ0_SITOR|nr:uncharacterized protein LOC115885761 [Sitophilus oryzae]